MKFVFDLDGTICFKGQPVSEEILVALEELVTQGHEVIFASARPIRDLLPVLHKRFHEYPMIGGNGAMVSMNGHIESTISFTENDLEDIVPLFKKYNISYLIDSEWDYAYTGPDHHPILHNLDPEERAINVRLDQLGSIIKILILTSDNMEDVFKHLRTIDVVTYRYGNEGVIDISPQGVDKWAGLKQLGVKENEYIAFGNDANDLTMFQHAKCAVMIGENAQLKPFSTDQIPLCPRIENNLVQKINELRRLNLS